MSKAQQLIEVFSEAFPGKYKGVEFTVWKSSTQKAGHEFLFNVKGHGDSGQGFGSENSAIGAAKQVIDGMLKDAK